MAILHRSVGNMTQLREQVNKRARVAIFFLNYNLGRSPSIINTIDNLAEQGYMVDIFTDSSQPVQAVFNGKLPIRLYTLGAVTQGSSPLKLAKFIRDSWRIIQSKGRYTCLIGFDPLGLAVAAFLGRWSRIPIIYWSLEIWLWHESHKLKLLEYLCHRGAEFTVIQDDDRAHFMADYHRIPRASFVMVPATARGPVYTQCSDYLRLKLGIPKEQKIILYAGAITDWAYCAELAAEAQNWPEEWTLVLHGFGEETYLEEIRGRCRIPGRVYLSLDFTPYDRLDQLVSSADLGLAFYEDRGPNWSLMGSASGKLSHYLKCGLPVITNDLPSLQQVVGRYGCGLCVSSPMETAAAARQIFADYSSYRARAIRCFQEKLNFDNYFGQVISRIETWQSQHLQGGKLKS